MKRMHYICLRRVGYRRTMKRWRPDWAVIIIMRTEKPQECTFSCHVAFETPSEILPLLRLPFFVVGKHDHRLSCFPFLFLSTLHIITSHKNADDILEYLSKSNFNDVRNRAEFHPLERNSDIRFYSTTSFSYRIKNLRHFCGQKKGTPHFGNIFSGVRSLTIPHTRRSHHRLNPSIQPSKCSFVWPVQDSCRCVHTQKLKNSTRMHGNNV